MDAAVPVGEEQTEEKEEHCLQSPAGGGNCVETVASTDCNVNRKGEAAAGGETTEPKERNEEQEGEEGNLTVKAKTNQASDDAAVPEEAVVELDSSPEKSATGGTKDGSALKSPEIETFSVDDEEEHEEEEVEQEEEEELDDEEYDEMDDDYEVYVEEKRSANRPSSTSSGDEASKLDVLSTDEYTDEDEQRGAVVVKKEAKAGAVPTAGRKSASDHDEDEEEEEEEEEEEDDDEVEIISCDDDNGEEEDEVDDDSVPEDVEEEEEEEDEENLLEEMHVEDARSVKVARKRADDSPSSPDCSPKLRVKYRNYQQKQTANLRKRAVRILNKRSMHVMEDSDDAVAVSSDSKVHSLTTNLKPAFSASPKEQQEQTLAEKPQVASTHVSTTITSTDSQNETKEPETTSTTGTASGDKEDPEAQAKHTPVAALAGEKSSNTISSTTPTTSSDDKMPTATAVEVSEKIADSSDDAVSVLSSSVKKTATTAITPTVNSSASTETVEQKSKVAEDDRAPETTGKAAVTTDESSVQESDKESDGKENKSDGVEVAHLEEQKKTSSPSPTDTTPLAEPTADDVMAGIDDIMEQNGSDDGGDEKENEKDFNDDLTFQMDVDDVPGPETRPPKTADKKEESAMDLSSPSDQPKEKGTVEAMSTEPEVRPDLSLPVGSERRASTTSQTAAHSKDANVDMHDQTVVTSTPVTDPKKAQQKRKERETDAASSPLEVKQEQEEETEATEAQNLSKQRAPSTRHAGETRQADTNNPATSRKRRRSIEIEEDRRTANADRPEPEESIEPAKKLKLEVEANYHTHERVVSEYIETTQNTSVDEIQNHTDALVKEIQTLNDMIRDTETKWNNLLHLKKVKEEILLRLNRRKHVINISETRLGEVSVYSHMDSTNLSSQHHQQPGGRSSSVGPRPPTPPPEVEIRPASVANSMHYGYNASSGSSTANGDKSMHFASSLISNRRSSTNSAVQTGNTSSSKRNAKDANSFVSQFNSSNNAVTMVPLPQTTAMILNARASMNSAEIAKEKATAAQIQRQILPKPVLSNHQQILNNLAMSAGLTGSSGGGSNSSSAATVGSEATFQAQLQAALFGNTNLLAGVSQALLNGHHTPGGSNSSSASHQQQLQIGRQGMRKDVSSIIADYRQKHPENVPRRGRRLKNVGGSSSSSNNNGTSTGNSIGTFGEGGAISLTALSGAKSPANQRPNSTDSVANRISELLAAAAETSRPSSNDSSQSSSNLLSSLMAAPNSSHQFFKDVVAQIAKMSQSEQSMLNLHILNGHPISSATNTVSSPQQSPPQQQQQQHHHQQHHHQTGGLHQQQSSLLSKNSLPEVTLHPVMNSTAHSDVLSGNTSHGNGSLTGANLSAVNNSTNSLLHGILTKSASRPGSAAAAAAAAAAVGNFNSFSPTLARLLTVPERMNSQSSSSTVTSGALASLQTNNLVGGLNLSKNTNEISITPVVGSNFQQTLLAQQQQQHQQLQRLREQQLYNLDDEADDSADRLVIDEGDDMGQRDSTNLLGGKRRGAEINENEVPQCQGCKKQEAKFVCAGCGNQWYCSRACQVNAWDDHSEVCSG